MSLPLGLPIVGVWILLYVVLPVSAGAASGTITECGAEGQLRADVSAGGSYAFACGGTVVLDSALLVSHPVSLTATVPNTVT
ncbi:MAG TPA: hypothetical protein VK778_11870 [Solirubrobacteraceae bacterium]|jgi:hypothetical protein|nr:hypothetical protein [Solirubrobacteraceae bacterium]